MRSILVHADGGPGNELRVQTALDLARLTDGHITLQINTPLQRFIAMDPFGGSYLIADALLEAETRDAALIAALTTKLSAEDVPWDSQTSNGIAADGLVEAGMLADLIILSLDRTDGKCSPESVDLVGDVVLNAPCPVLAVPTHAKPMFVTGTALIAWADGPEAAGAMRAAVPLLALASSVKLVTVSDEAHFFPSTEAIRYLSRHGIHAELVERPRDDRHVGEALAEAATALAADWVVMGAYSHSRFRQSLFGGVTQFFLESGQFPLLLSH